MRKLTLFFCCALLFLSCTIAWAKSPFNIRRLRRNVQVISAPQLYQRILATVPDSLQALARLEEFLSKSQNYRGLVWVAEELVRKGELEKARELLQALVKRLPWQAGNLQFRIAEIYYFQGKFSKALSLCQQLIKGELSEDYVNEALEKMVFIRENLSNPKALKLFATAQFFVRQQKYQQALNELDQLKTTFPGSSLNDDLLLLTSEIREEMGDFQAAIEACRRLLAEYPHSSLCPEAQKRIGEIYEQRLQDYPAAEREYKRFLVSYPHSVLASEVRGRLQKLMLKGRKSIL